MWTRHDSADLQIQRQHSQYHLCIRDGLGMQRCQRSVMVDAFSGIPSVLRVLLKCSEHWYGRCQTGQRKHLLLDKVLWRVQRLGLIPERPGPALCDRLGLSAAAGFHKGTPQNNTPAPSVPTVSRQASPEPMLPASPHFLCYSGTSYKTDGLV